MIKQVISYEIKCDDCGKIYMSEESSLPEGWENSRQQNNDYRQVVCPKCALIESKYYIRVSPDVNKR